MKGAELQRGDPRGRRWDLVLTAICFVAACALYLSTFSPRAFALLWADDGMHYARWAVDGNPAELAHPHHILYHFLAQNLMRVMAWFYGPGIETSLRAHQVLSAIGGALGVAATFLLARTVGARTLPALALAAFLATIFPYWCFSSVSETYAPAHACTALLFLTLAAEQRTQHRFHRIAWPIAIIVLGFVLREDMGLCLPAYALGVWAQHGFKQGTLRGITVAATSLAITAAIYGAIYLLAVRGTSFAPDGFAKWFAGYQEDGRYGISEHYFDQRLPLELHRLGESIFPWWAAGEPRSFAILGPLIVPVIALVLFVLGLRRKALRPMTIVAGSYFALRIIFYAWWEAGYFDFEFGHVAALGFLLAATLPAIQCTRFPRASVLLIPAMLITLAAVQASHVWRDRLPSFHDTAAWDRMNELDRYLLPDEAVAGLRTDTRLGSIGYLGRDVLELDPRKFVAQIDKWLNTHPQRSLFLPMVDLQEIFTPTRPEWGLMGSNAEARLREVAGEFQELTALRGALLITDATGAPYAYRF